MLLQMVLGLTQIPKLVWESAPGAGPSLCWWPGQHQSMEVAACIRFSLGLASTLQQPGTILQQVNEHQAMGWSTELFIFEKKWGKTKQTDNKTQQTRHKPCCSEHAQDNQSSVLWRPNNKSADYQDVSLAWKSSVQQWPTELGKLYGVPRFGPGALEFPSLHRSWPVVALALCSSLCKFQLLHWRTLYYIGYQGRLRNAGYLFHPVLFLFHIYAA